ncbi:MAG: thiamine pyrophosphate-dependent dehydrogenase E1 component subunit alpha [Novosphingobium sp.]|nr:thiamine pyrophosphate-dependent dehydrogenase E1 component subunit alpha [Novosphingobium sp.]
MYSHMVLSRAFERMMDRAYMEGKTPVFDMAKGPVPGEMHLSDGQEPCAVGVCVHLNEDDYAVGSHRPHHVAIAKGVDLDAMTAEMFGRESGLSKGRGGHMHLYDQKARFACSGIVGQGIGIGVGHALAIKMQGGNQVAVAWVGEGGANQGMFHEAMNLAGLWKLPFILVVEDNDWSVSVPKERSTAIARNSDRAASYNAAGEYVADNDVWGVYAAGKRAVDRARAGDGPTIIEVRTHRLVGHFVGDPEIYISEEKKRALVDPLVGMRQRLMDEGIIDAADVERIDRETEGRLAAAEQFARSSTEPACESALDHVFV